MNLFLRKGHTRYLIVICSVFAVVLLFIAGCRKDFDFSKTKDLSWNPDIALQLVHDSLTLTKVLIQTGTEDRIYIEENGDISILFYFNNDAFRIRPGDLITLAPANYSYNHYVSPAEQYTLQSADVPIPPTSSSLNLVGDNPDLRIDRLMVKKGFVRITSDNTFNNAGFMTLKMLNATKNGVPFAVTISPFVSGQTHTDIDLSDVLFDFTATPNTIKTEIEGLLKKSGEPVAGDQIRMDFQFNITTIGRFEGYLGRYTFPQLQDTVKVDVFNNAYVLGEVYFVDPQATITVYNSIGIPAEIKVEKLVSINNASGVSLDIASQLGSGAVFSVPSPLINDPHPAVKSMYYTNDNTNNAMYDFYNMKPDNVAFQITAKMNPEGTPINFFSDTSSFFSDLRVKLPLYGHFDHLTFQDTFDLALDKPEEIERLEFKTNIVNGFPLNTLMQVYFTDEYYNIKDSLAGQDEIMIREAPVDPATHLPYPGMYGVKDTTFILNMERMKNLENVKKLLVKAELNSSNGGNVNVKLRSDQLLKLNFSARAKLRTTIETGK